MRWVGIGLLAWVVGSEEIQRRPNARRRWRRDESGRRSDLKMASVVRGNYRSTHNKHQKMMGGETYSALRVDGEDLNKYCTGKRKSRDVIIYLGQKQHSSYDATHANTLNASMASLRANMRKIGETDVIVWHEGDLTRDDANALEGAANVRFCTLTNATGWEVPRFVEVAKLPPMQWSLGYRKMIRFYAVTVWATLKRLGYDWVMRMDDDSFVLSEIDYNVFGEMRRRGDLYAYRMLSAECPRTFGDFVKSFSVRQSAKDPSLSAKIDAAMRDAKVDAQFVTTCTKFPRHCRAPAKRQKLRQEFAKLDTANNPDLVAFSIARGMPYCSAVGQFGYYNNWFVTEIDWWLNEPNVAAMIRDFDLSKLIFTHRSNDLIFQTAAIRLFLPPSKRHRFVDFTYQHHTTRHGHVTYGGIESGTRDPDAKTRLAAYAEAYGGKLTSCKVKARHASEPVSIFLVNPGPTSTAPFCGQDGAMDFI